MQFHFLSMNGKWESNVPFTIQEYHYTTNCDLKTIAGRIYCDTEASKMCTMQSSILQLHD
jgi:hypothetical protein